ncbi:adenylate/guanylate cyclase domain-containing protein [Jiangella endophytica]|uniref:adenylate/guanylate cyclase domain-containing protein n=1 Tax=Jiangella endophytica TaxID=1623398 RepID=UPI000E3422A1|nr:adenylate/guanylate cyclase domain-containing protein [Jiangella endophytica]
MRHRADRPSGLRRLAALGADESAAEDERLRRSTLVLSTGLVCALTPFWIVTYLLLGLPVAALIPLVYLVVSAGSLAWFARTRRFVPFRAIQLTMMLVLPFALQWSLGGFAASGAVCLWALSAALGALMFMGPREAIPWFVAYLVLLGISAVLDPRLDAADIPEGVRIAFFAGDLAGPSLVAYLLLQYFVRGRDREHARSERLLLNVLPAPVAARLKRRDGIIADRHAEATVLFADIVDFTPLSVALPPEDVVRLLDDVFSAFDRLADEHGLEKIKTIGDAYMVAGGVPVPRDDDCEAVADMALAMQRECERRGPGPDGLRFRIGMDTGPVVAGVIGRRKFIYDLWGDTVNTASRMESHGLPGAIQVSPRVHERLRGRYRFRSRGTIEVKGKGPMPTWLLLGRAPIAGSDVSRG